MSHQLAGKVALVTGSTMGIGRACAKIFAEEGARVVINGYPPEQGADVVALIEARGGIASYFCADVGMSDELQALIQHAVDIYGRLDILMNNAIDGKNAPLLEQGEADWERIFATSIKACYLGCKFAIPEMLKNGAGVIINTSSVHGLLGGRGAPAYDAAKAAIINFTRQIAVEYGRLGIRANALCPGRILTESKLVWLESHPDEIRRQCYIYPLGRPGTLREIAQAALFLASDQSSFVTGHALVVDGGLTAQLQDGAAAFAETQVLRELAAHDVSA